MGERSFIGDENARGQAPRRRRVPRAHEETTERFFTARPGLDTPEGGREETPVPEAGSDLWAGQAPRQFYARNEPQEATVKAPSPSGEGFRPNETSHEVFGQEEECQEPAAPGAQPLEDLAASYYCRPSHRGDSLPEGPQETAFAPPPKLAHMLWEEPQEAAEPAIMPKRQVYQPREATWAHTARRESLALQEAHYQVEANRNQERPKASNGRKGRRILAAACLVAALGVGAYVGRGWIAQQIALLTGAEPVNAAQEGAAGPSAAGRGFDPAPGAQLGVKAQQGIAAVSGTLEMEPVAITTANVLTRTPVGAEAYDYYLFAGSDGRLLAYFDGLTATDFIPQPNDCFYVSKAPYLLNSQGKALIRPEAYRQAAGENAVLGPLENGWALIQDQAGAKFNYINAEGNLLSALWFCRAFPFWGERTLAYVDTGNVAKPEERYALYVISAQGDMDFWRHASHTREVVNAACDLALLDTGELVRLEDLATVALVDGVAAYLDCEAVVARDRETGRHALFAAGEQHYDFAYERIAPVPCEIQWAQSAEGSWVNYAVIGAEYPQPLSHYFRLQRAQGEEQVALSARSCCPVLMK